MLIRAVAVAILATVSVSAQSASPQVLVPFVGCPSEGQAGPFDPPKGSPKAVALPAALAEQIAYYVGEHSQGVFAPRGWHCQVIYGSSGGTLVVTPAAVDPSQLYRSKVRGHAVELEGIASGGSGRFQVAAVSSLLFPKAAAAFIKQVRDLEPEILRDELEALPHAKDSIGPVVGTLARFATPADARGLGTACSLAPTGDAIHGVAVLHEGYLSILRLRLGQNMDSIEGAILRLNHECMLNVGGC
jgi:hypothetical protein